MEKVLYKLLSWIVNDCSEDICKKLCAFEEEAEKAANEEFSDDIPEDIEPCKFKRESGCAACFKGIIEKFGGISDNGNNTYEQGKLEAAKEIFPKVYGYTCDNEVGTRYLIRELALEYGVELPKMPRKGLNGFEVKK